MTYQLPDTLEAPGYGIVGDTYVSRRLPDSSAIEGCECQDAIYGSTACWEGYTAQWRLDGDQLFLIGLKGRARLRSPTPIQAHWISEVVFVDHGRVLGIPVEEPVTTECAAFEFENGRLRSVTHWRAPSEDSYESLDSRQRFQRALLNASPRASPTLWSDTLDPSDPFADRDDA